MPTASGRETLDIAILPTADALNVSGLCAGSAGDPVLIWVDVQQHTR